MINFHLARVKCIEALLYTAAEGFVLGGERLLGTFVGSFSCSRNFVGTQKLRRKFSNSWPVCHPSIKTEFVKLILVLLSLPGLIAYHLLSIFKPLLEHAVFPFLPILF